LAPWVRAQPTLLQQAQAADLLSGLLTYYDDLTTARHDAMRSYLQQIGKLEDYQTHKPAAPPRQEPAFDQAFKGAVLFVQQRPGNAADTALGKMPTDQLRTEFAAIQAYNLQQFIDLTRKRDEVGSMKAYLDQKSQFDGYMRWAQQNLAIAATAAPATRPTTQSAQAFADWIADQAGDLKAKAWEQAQARGVSREDFEKQWQDKLVELRRRIDSRIQTMRQLAGGLQHGVLQPATRAAGGAQPSAAELSPAGQTPPAFAAAPVSPQDPRWAPYYYGPQRQFNTWGDVYPDVYRPGVNGGVFRSYDLRLNQDYDARVNGELDRRQNTNGDRRLDFRIDPRVNY
jgi:hypothetical protein